MVGGLSNKVQVLKTQDNNSSKDRTFFAKVEIVGFGSKGLLGLAEWFTWGPTMLGLVPYKYSLGLFSK